METKKATRLMFSFNRELMSFIILNKVVFYCDKVWSNWIQIVPKDERVTKQILMSRNKIPKHLIKMFDLSPSEMEEYKTAKDDEAIAEIVIKDAQKKGCKLEKQWLQKEVSPN